MAPISSSEQRRVWNERSIRRLKRSSRMKKRILVHDVTLLSSWDKERLVEGNPSFYKLTAYDTKGGRLVLKDEKPNKGDFAPKAVA
jgi:hypothetical protein